MKFKKKKIVMYPQKKAVLNEDGFALVFCRYGCYINLIILIVS